MADNSEYAIEMLGITKRFPGIIANDNVTIQLKKGEIHALLGENGAGKSTLMSVLFGLYQAEEGVIKKDGKEVQINNPNDANDLGIGMVHQHFKLVQCFSVLDNIILGVETVKNGFLQKDVARKKILELSEKYGLKVDPDAKIEDITVGMQQRTEILKMLYRDNEILIFDEPTAVLTPQEIELLRRQAKQVLFPRLQVLAAARGLHYQKVSIRKSRTRWGSCSSKGNISLSLYLMLLPPYLQDYVMQHELTHLVEMNHSPRFWALLDEATEGNSRQYRAALKRFSSSVF